MTVDRLRKIVLGGILSVCVLVGNTLTADCCRRCGYNEDYECGREYDIDDCGYDECRCNGCRNRNDCGPFNGPACEDCYGCGEYEYGSGCGCGCGFTGFYFGGSLGFACCVSKYKQHISLTEEDQHTDFGLEGLDGGLQAGFGGSLIHPTRGWGGVYIGVELAGLACGAKGRVDVSSLNGSTGTIRTHSLRARMRDSIELVFRLGFPIRRFAMPYIRIGGSNARWEFQHVVSEDLIVIGVLNRERKRRLSAVLIGVGTEILLCNNFIVGIEVDYYKFKTQTLQLASPLIDYLARAQFKPRYTRGALRVSYLF